MSLAALLGLETRNPGECIVKIGGSEFSEFYANLQKTEVRLTRKGSAQATLTFVMTRDNGRYELAEDPRIRSWAPIEIIVVFGATEEPFFDGYIQQISTSVPEQGQVATVTLSCQDRLAAMDRNQRNLQWEDQTDIDIISTLLAGYDILLNTDLVPTAPVNYHQNQTDYRFLRTLVGQNYEWYLRNTEGTLQLFYGSPRTTAEASGKTLLVNAGRNTNCTEFNVSFDGYTPDRIRVSTAPLTGDEISIAEQNPVTQLMGNRPADSADSGLEEFAWNQPPGNGNDQQAAEASALASAEENALKLKANGKLIGTVFGQLLLPGSMVEVGGTGDNNGKWYVDTTTHTFDSSNYIVDFQLIRNAAAGDEQSDEHILAGIL